MQDKYSAYQSQVLSDKVQLLQNLERDLTWKKHLTKMAHANNR